MANNKEFCGSVKLKRVEGRNGNKNWAYHQVSFTKVELKKMEGFFNKEGYVNLKINKSQSSDGYYMEIDTYGLPKPGEGTPEPEKNDAPEPEDEFPDLEDAFEN